MCLYNYVFIFCVFKRSVHLFVPCNCLPNCACLPALCPTLCVYPTVCPSACVFQLYAHLCLSSNCLFIFVYIPTHCPSSCVVKFSVYLCVYCSSLSIFVSLSTLYPSLYVFKCFLTNCPSLCVFCLCTIFTPVCVFHLSAKVSSNYLPTIPLWA